MKRGEIRLCHCGCGQPSRVYRSADGLNKGWRGYASGHAPNERVEIRIPQDPVDLGYLCGLIDGEGCIFAKVYTYKNSLNTLITLSINMNSEIVINWLHGMCGGQVYSDTAPSRRAELFHWQVRGRKIIPLLEAVLPHLKEKKQRAYLAIQLASLISHGKSGSGRKISESEWKIRQDLAAQIKAFNQNPAGEVIQ